MQSRTIPHRPAPRAPHPIASWDDLRVLLAVARAGNLATAGRELGVDASTASRRVAALERALGVTLFLRTREGLRPTAEADRLRAHAERIEEEVRAAGAEPLPGEGVVGLVRLATSEALVGLLVQLGLGGLLAEHPALSLELLGGNLPLDLAAGEADLALRTSRPRQADLVSRLAVDSTLALYAAPGYLRARGTPAADLAGHDVLLHSGELAALPEARWLSRCSRARVVLRSNSVPSLIAAAARGLGLAVTTRAWGDRTAGLERVRELPELGRRRLWLVVPRLARERAAVRVVADRVVRLLAGSALPAALP